MSSVKRKMYEVKVYGGDEPKILCYIVREGNSLTDEEIEIEEKKGLVPISNYVGEVRAFFNSKKINSYEAMTIKTLVDVFFNLELYKVRRTDTFLELELSENSSRFIQADVISKLQNELSKLNYNLLYTKGDDGKYSIRILF